MTLETNNSLSVRPAGSVVKLTKVAQRAASSEAGRPVQHWGVAEVMGLVDAARKRGRGQKGERDALLIQVLFDPALRASEALGVRPMDVIRTEGGYRLQVDGKTGPRQVAVSPSLVARLQSYAYETGMAKDAQFFPRSRIVRYGCNRNANDTRTAVHGGSDRVLSESIRVFHYGVQ